MDIVRTYFTFGPAHAEPRIPDPSHQYVVVEVPEGLHRRINPRSLLISWLGSNRFAFEYDEDDFREYREKYPVTVAARIVVSVHENP